MFLVVVVAQEDAAIAVAGSGLDGFVVAGSGFDVVVGTDCYFYYY